ncbi:signal transduction histidine kinase regulating citrate/malate metabolism [Saccharomonospora marina XMU15]|uniref:histidine kinase n=1 Tax=Saccharomonospora marina XMU15 TaxID=882083 RepID=H5WZK0_9PSEU|nr:ATP-binding protein [Saccharomonospora marina]EHR50732.1 signal transduction histidine kinase regulating citrate/malate metabolism [Saccharomonospora marina XMU15]
MVIRSRPSLAGQLLAIQVVVILLVLVTVAALSLAQSAATFNRVEGRRVVALAEQLATNPLVRNQLDGPTSGEALATHVQTVRTQAGVTSVTIADAAGRVLSSTNPILVRTRLPLGDARVAQGRGWSGELEVDGGTELAAQVPVIGATAPNLGRVLGTVMIGETMPTLWQRLRGASSYLAIYLGVASFIGLLGSWLLARRIKRQTFGMEPREIAGLAEHREAMLYGIAEGVIALDPHHRVTLVNEVARTLLDLPGECVGKSLGELGIEGRLRDVLLASDSGPDTRDEVVLRRGRVLIMNRMEVTKDGTRLGSVTTLRDRTELAERERELGSFRSSTELLRAQAHEFANQLHTISGLIQIGEYDEVVRYVDALKDHRHSLDLTVTRRVSDTAIAALLMAKSAQAAERRVELRISERTSLQRLDPHDAADVATVVGNLIDNAVDATGESTTGAWVEVQLRQDASSVEVVVQDSGPGVAPELAREVFSHGFTTKAAKAGERGIGLALTRRVCKRRGGEITVTNTADGAMFTARMSVGQPAGHAGTANVAAGEAR